MMGYEAIKKEFLDSVYEKFKSSQNTDNGEKRFIAFSNYLNLLRYDGLGFSFRFLTDDGYNNPAKVSWKFIETSHLIRPHLRAFLDVGKLFFSYLVRPDLNCTIKTNLIGLSEEQNHIYHNAAVLWLEEDVKKRSNLAEKYEKALKDLWLNHFIKYEENLAAKDIKNYLFEHATLGKVLRRRNTQFHEKHTIRLHPSYWGLFLFSPRQKFDKRYHLNFVERKWWYECAYGPKLNSFIPVYEDFPRDYRDPAFAPRNRVYLHRSKAHGRADFLTYVPRNYNVNSNPLVVFCTKGVGYDYDRLGQIRKEYEEKLKIKLKDPWYNPYTTLLPFKSTDTDTTHPTLGYFDDEWAVAEYFHLEDMYDRVKELSAFGKNGLYPDVKTWIQHLPNIFVEPYACVEVSVIRKNLDRLDQALKNAAQRSPYDNLSKNYNDKYQGYPTQLIYGAPHETSLRLYKEGKDASQNYDFSYDKGDSIDRVELELAELERCVGMIVIPPPVLSALEVEAEQNQQWSETMLNGDIAATAGLKEQRLRRTTLAYQLSAVMLTSFMAFMTRGCVTGESDNSYNGRNFSSGPRDSPGWHSFEPDDKDGLLNDLHHLGNSVKADGDVMKFLGLTDLSKRSSTSKRADRWFRNISGKALLPSHKPSSVKHILDSYTDPIERTTVIQQFITQFSHEDDLQIKKLFEFGLKFIDRSDGLN